MPFVLKRRGSFLPIHPFFIPSQKDCVILRVVSLCGESQNCVSQSKSKTDMRPPGLSTRVISESASSASGTCMSIRRAECIKRARLEAERLRIADLEGHRQ